MGAWGAGSFDNDEANDFADDLVEGTVLLDELLETVDAAEEINALEATQAIAAAETVAALRRKPNEKIPEELEIWVSKQRMGFVDAQLAIRVVEKIREESELKQQWDDAAEEEKNAWYAAIDDLLARLRAR
jgi:hypothetical protein